MKMYKYDVYRYYGRYNESIKEHFNRPNGLQFLFYYRKYYDTNNKLLKKYLRYKLNRLAKKNFIQIPYKCTIGKGFYIGHNGPVIINPNVVIGDNCNIAVGVTIGQENRETRKGAPTIGNNVWIGTNAVIVGKIKIGNDVLIAPNSYINFDVSDHSIVIGNPGKIIKKQNATDEYINRTI